MPSESATRRDVVNVRLREAGWDVADRTQVVEEFFVSLSDDAQVVGSTAKADSIESAEFSDYVLLGKNGKPLAVVEAKRSSRSAELGREQAKQYCLNIQSKQGGELPFCFYTNGHEIFFWNLGKLLRKRSTASPRGRTWSACSSFGKTGNPSAMS